MRPLFAVVTAIVCSSCVEEPSILPLPSTDFPTTGSSGTAGSVGGSGGSRIGFYGLESSDGAWQFAGWYDSTLDIKCALRKLLNGNTYCVPTEHLVESVIPGSSANAVYYTDETCATAFLEWNPESSCSALPPRYVIQTYSDPSDTCGARSEQQLFRLGGAVEVTAGEKWYQIVRGECVELLDAPPGTHRGLLATRITEDEFVQFVEKKN
jgi:hypothetical protein